jgi:hypothetical protein
MNNQEIRKSGRNSGFVRLLPGESVSYKSDYVFGILNPRPLVGVGSKASYRIRLRNDDFGYIFVSRKHLGVFGKYPLMEQEGVWFPDYDMPQAENYRAIPNSLQSKPLTASPA